MNNAWQAASQDIYQAQQQAGGAEPQEGPAGNQGGNAKADDVTDVEFEEVGGDKK